MATFKRFEEIDCWKRARELTRAIYSVSSKSPFSRDFGLKDQIRKASVSVMSNIAEGFERRRRTEFFRFLEIAKGSCAEVSSHLYVAFDVGYVAESQFLSLLGQASELQRILGGLKASVARSADAERGGPQARASGLGTRNS